jgi:hypothetical protein
MFKIIAVVVIGILVGIGFFDIGQEAYTLAALLLVIGALVDPSQKRSATPSPTIVTKLPSALDGSAKRVLRPPN